MRRPFASVRARLALLATLPLVPLLAMFVHSAADLHRIFEQSEITANREIARVSAAAFAAFVGEVERTVLPAGEAIASGRLSSQQATALLERTASEYASVRELSWTSPSGAILLSSNPRALGVEVGDRDYFARLARGEDVAVSDLLKARTLDGYVFVIARAVRGPSSRLVGAVLAVVDPDLLRSRVLSTERIGDAALTLVDRSGRIVFRSPPIDLSWELRDIAPTNTLVQRALRGEEAGGVFSSSQGGDRLGAAVPIRDLGWAIHASRAAGEAIAPVRRELAQSAVVGLVAAALSLGASMLVGGRITRALRRLEAHAEALGRGERVPAPMFGAPEVDRLACAYGAMAARVQSAHDRLQILHHCSKLMSESLDVGEVAQRLVRCAVDTVADWCIVEELLPDGSFRPLAAAHAAPEPHARAAELRTLDAGAPGSFAWVAASERRAVHLPDANAEVIGCVPDAPQHVALFRRAGVRSWVSVPLVVSDEVVGVLSMATAGSGRLLDAADVRLVEEVASRAAQAITNARLFGEVERAVRGRDDVLSIVSHDLRNPLGAITLGAHVIADLPDGPGALERARATARRMVAAGQRMARLINDLLDLSSLRARRLAMNRAPCTPADLLNDAVEELRGAARQKGLTLDWAISGPLPAATCDHERVLQVIENLASNAIKATEHGGVRLAAEPGDGEIVFSVTDTGPGIPEEEQALLFEPFRRGAGAGYRGIGLGLAIARALVEAHGGRIWIESRLGEGTTARFTIPAAQGGRAGDPPSPPADQEGGGAAARGAAAPSFGLRPSTVP